MNKLINVKKENNTIILSYTNKTYLIKILTKDIIKIYEHDAKDYKSYAATEFIENIEIFIENNVIYFDNKKIIVEIMI